MTIIEEEVVISGIGGWFPKANNIDDFGHLLLRGTHLIEPKWDKGKFNINNFFGTINEPDRFDASFFSINPKQCEEMDILSRKTLEASFSALIDAGVNPDEIRGTNTCVSVGSSMSECERNIAKISETGFGVTGQSRTMLSNRISYYLNLNGPSVSIISSWISGLQSLKYASDLIKNGACKNAIIGDCNFLLHPEIFWIYNELGILSNDGLTRSFDKNANGYGRSDCIVIFFLQRARDAKRCYAYIDKIDTTFIGNKTTDLFSVKKNEIIRFLEKFYQNYTEIPHLEYLETYGAGIKDFDEAELNAVEQIICKKFHHSKTNPLLIGSIKSIIGHSEGAASLISLVKIIIAMERKIIPANKNFYEANPNIQALKNGTMKIVNKNTHWNGLYAAMNCFGLAGDFGHIILKSEQKNNKYQEVEIPKLLLISSISEKTTIQTLNKIDSMEKITQEYMQIVNDCFSKTISGHFNRGFYLIEHHSGNKIKYYQNYNGLKKPIWFVYSGMGCQWKEMGKDLLKLPLFFKSIDKCNQTLKPYGVNLFKILTDKDENIFDDILNSFVGITAIQIALTDILKAIGIEPDGIIGHSMGETGCAYGDNCLTIEQTILISYLRGKISKDNKSIKGLMAAVGMGHKEIKNICPNSIEVACHNGPDNCTISGPADDIKDFVQQLSAKGIFTKIVNVSNIAYHSRYIYEFYPKLKNALSKYITNPKKRSSKWISTSVLFESWDTEDAKYASATYFANNLKNYVYFEEGLKFIPKNAILIEIAPHGILQAILKRSLNSTCKNIALLKKTNENSLDILFSAFGHIYSSGCDINVNILYPKIPYPVSNGTPSTASLVNWNHDLSYIEAFNNPRQEITNNTVTISRCDINYKEALNYQLFLNKRTFMPSSLFLMIILTKNYDLEKLSSFTFQKLNFENVMELTTSELKKIEVMVQLENKYFEISLKDSLLVNGYIDACENLHFQPTIKNYIKHNAENFPEIYSKDFIYKEFEHRGYYFKENLKQIHEIRINNNGVLTAIIDNDIKQFKNIPYNLIEAALQLILFYEGEKTQYINIIDFIQELSIDLKAIQNSKHTFIIDYDTITKTLYSNMLVIKGPKLKPLFNQYSNLNYQLDQKIFIEFHKNFYEHNKTLYQWLDIALQIVYNNLPINNKTQLRIFLCDNFQNIDLEIINLICENRFSHLQYCYKTFQEDLDVSNSLILSKKEIDIKITDNYFMIVNDFIENENSNNYIVITKFITPDEKKFYLIKKRNLKKPIIIKIQDSKSFSSIEYQKESWYLQLKSNLNTNKNQRIILILNLMLNERIQNFIEKILLLSHNIEFIFIENINDWNQIEKFLEYNLSIMVIRKNNPGFYGYLFFENIQSNLESLPLSKKYLIDGNFLMNKSVKYLGIIPFDEIQNEANYSKKWDVSDYVCKNVNDEFVMGLCQTFDGFDKTADSILYWKIPDKWSLEEAITIPHAYSLTYYALFDVGKLKTGSKVLVHEGLKPLSQAAINILHEHKCHIFITVDNEEQIIYLNEKYPFLNKENCFLVSNFYSKLMIITDGNGINIVFNGLDDENIIELSFQTLMHAGKLLQFYSNKLNFGTFLGMRSFLNGSSLIPIFTNDIFILDSDKKITLKNRIDEGIKNNTIKPLEKQLINNFNTSFILRHFENPKAIEKLFIDVSLLSSIDFKTNKFQCVSSDCYLIYGKNAEQVIELTEWIVYRGGKNIAIFSTNNFPNNDYVKRHLKLLKEHYNAEIKLIFTNFEDKLHNVLIKFLFEVKKLFTIGAIFMLPIFEDDKNDDLNYQMKENIETIIRKVSPNVLFICLLIKSINWTIGSFINQNINTYCIDEENNRNESLKNLLEILDIILLENKSMCILKKVETNILKTHKNDLKYLLPKQLDDLNWIYENELRQLPSESTKTLCETPPVFLLPGFRNIQTINQFTMSLYNPVFLIDQKPIQNYSLKQRVHDITKNMIKIYSKGPFNIIGVSIDGIISIEIAKKLEKLGYKTKIFLIDGAPETIRTILKNQNQFKMEFLVEWFQIDNKLPPGNLSNEEKYLNIIFYRINELFDYFENNKFQDPLFNGEIHLIKPMYTGDDDDCGLSKICKQTIKIDLVQGNHRSILLDSKLAQIINYEILIYNNYN